MSSCPQEPEQEASQPPEAWGAHHKRASALRPLRALRRAAGLGGGRGGVLGGGCWVGTGLYSGAVGMLWNLTHNTVAVQHSEGTKCYWITHLKMVNVYVNFISINYFLKNSKKTPIKSHTFSKQLLEF